MSEAHQHEAYIEELIAYLRCLTPEQVSPLSVPALPPENPYAPVFTEVGRAQQAMNEYAAEKRLTTAVVAKINALMGHLADPNVHEMAREQFLEIITQAAGYRYALLAEQDGPPHADQMRLTAVYGSTTIRQRLHRVLGQPLKGYRFTNRLEDALQTPAVEVVHHISDMHSVIPRPMGTAVGKFLNLDEIVIIRQTSGDKYLGAVTFFSTQEGQPNQSLLISLCNNYLVYALRLLQEQESLHRLYKSYTLRLEKEVSKRTAALETSLKQARAAERRRQEAEERTRELNVALRQERDTLEARVIERTQEIQSLARFPEEHPSPVLRVDEHGRVLYRNPASHTLDNLFHALAEPGYIPPDWQKVLTRILEEQTSFELDYQFEGQILWCKFSPVPQERYVNIYSQDITERTRAEQALRASEERLSLIVDNALDAVITMDAHGRIASWNKQAELTFGWSHRAVIGRQLSEVIVPPQHREAHEKGLRRFLQTGQPGKMLNRRTETTAVDQTGHEFPIEIAITAVDLEGTTMFNAFVRDIASRIQASSELKRAKEEAEAAAQAKSLFLANMSHEIRTPLNAIVGLSDLLLDSDLNPQQQEHLYMVRRSGDALLSIINDILDFSKIDAGKMELEQSDFYLRSVLEDATGILRQKAQMKGLELSYKIDPLVPNRLVGDMTRLRQVLVNLINNGLKFTETGEVTVLVTAVAEKEGETNLSPNQIELHFRVTDTGIGIPPDRLDRLFQSFSQVDASTTRRFGGTGLGLAISKRLVELMDGTIWVESEVRRGSTFHFKVLLGIALKPDTALLSQVWTKLDFAHIFMVTTHQNTYEFLAKYAEAWQMSFFHARTLVGAERQLQMQDKLPTAVIIDLDGLADDPYELTLALRQRLPGIPLISLSKQQATLTPALRVLYDGHVYKPLHPSRLYNMLAALTADEETLRAAKAGRTAVHNITNETEMGIEHPLRILIAEDNPINQQVALSMLKRLGYKADVANNGLEALQRLHAQSYDVVLMDVQMPHMDGVTTTQRIRAEFSSDEQPWIVAMTANALKGDRETYLASGMNDYISKPVRLVELAQLLGDAPVLASAVDKTSANADDRNRDGSGDGADVAPVDVDAFFKMLGVEDWPLLIDILPAFAKEARNQIAYMYTAVDKQDPDLLERASHMLKGSAASVGAVTFAQMSAQINKTARQGLLPEDTAVLTALEQELTRIEQQSDQLQQTHGE